MKIKRIGVALAAVAAASALALTGCSGTSNNSSGDEIKQNQSLTIAQNGPFNAYNSNVGQDYTTYNTNVTYMTWASFNYYDNTPKLVKNTKFGSYKVVSQNPLTIKYTVNKGVKWSDGTPVTAADLLLQWASNTVKYNSSDAGGVNFGGIAAGSYPYDETKAPTVGDDDRSITFSYSDPFVDWEQLAFNPGIAAHAVYDVAFPDQKLSGADAAKKVEDAIESDDTATLTKIANAWQTGFEFSGDLPANKELYLSDGPYVITGLKKDQYVTLERNKNYTWGPIPKVDKLTIRFIQDPTAQVQALQNGEVSIIYGQADADTVASLKGLKGVTTGTEAGYTYEHVDLTFSNETAPGGQTNANVTPGPFDPAHWGGDANKAKLVREAFLAALPRQDIVDKLIKPINPDAKVMNSQTILPGTPAYDTTVASNGSAAYDKVDIAKAKSLLQQAGVTSPLDVRFLYGKSNTRRAQEFALIKDSEAQAGFNVIDDGDDKWSSILGNGSYDASLFAWQYTSLAVTGNQAALQGGGGNNFNGYANTTADADWTTLAKTFDKSKQNQLLADIDKQMWGDAYGATIFQFPDVYAASNNVKNVSYSPIAPNQFWNFWEWTK
ncbi:ABC transporter family substrate-binding protein [Gryllotalpicola protaetiae]|uniref:ABC transporter family substrate-binding protein n=1 Tax=Gryllotalpicola protaetiae TaxID=2419771 RepID=A0A387BJW5_9MICO|nr:ABC transporter family substrate-binding protein [Gryllotalpicola protaetiae]AYG02562.1 ABC transporter family substrate-binding protein [Gryllotalpicola protaetiae]